MLWFHFYYNSTLMCFRSRCFDDEKQKKKTHLKTIASQNILFINAIVWY